jgi:hypothetical protein
MLPPEVVGKPKDVFEKGKTFGVTLVSIKNSDDAARFTQKLRLHHIIRIPAISQKS